jgi:hypothetical protein
MSAFLLRRREPCNHSSRIIILPLRVVNYTVFFLYKKRIKDYYFKKCLLNFRAILRHVKVLTYQGMAHFLLIAHIIQSVEKIFQLTKFDYEETIKCVIIVLKFTIL